nr:hypothetical protein [Sphingopyxis sp.]
MVDDLDVERPSDHFELPRRLDVFDTGAMVAARMVVDENQPRSIEFERTPEDRPGVDGKLRKRAALQNFVGEKMVPTVEKEDAKPLVGERPHRHDEIGAEPSVEGIDADTSKVARKALGGEFARLDNDLCYLRGVIKNASERFRRLRPNAADRMKRDEKPVR